MFLTFILPILLFTYRDGQALPLSSSNATSLPWDSRILATIDCKAQPPRTLFGIAWSCILTVFICAWTSVHPNVPPKGRMGGLLARVKLMFWTIVAPELVLAWAVRQWFAAKETRDLYNKHRGNRLSKRWTTAHGHFLEMGGFMLMNDKIHRLEEADQPGWLSTTADWDTYAEYVRQRQRCQLGTLTFERLKELVGDPNVVFPAITPAQIQDRSKGDGLSKLLAILQTSWFILQCIARGFQGLALTELELVTLAMASLNAITYAFWWSKPLSVQEPVDVYVTGTTGLAVQKVAQEFNKDDNGDVPYTTEDVIGGVKSTFQEAVGFLYDPQIYATFRREGCTRFFDLVLYLVLLPLPLLFVLTYPVFLLFPLGILFLLWIIKTEKVNKAQDADDGTVATRIVFTLRKFRYNLTHPIRRYFGDYFGPLDTIYGKYFYSLSFIMNWFFFLPASFFLLVLLLIILSPLFAIFFVASFTFTAAFEIVTTNTVRPGATHVPAFYAPRTKSDKYSRMIVFAIFGVIFGGIHCIAWNFAFPTHSERSLWRYTSVVLTAIPLVAAPIDCILENVKLQGRVGKRFRLLLGIIMTALLSLYVPARLSLIVQALALLRDQPAAAYVAVNWTKYIPHLFS